MDDAAAILVGRKHPLTPAVMRDGKPTGGETITSNNGHVRLAVYEGRIAPEDAMAEVDRIGAAQTIAHGEQQYQQGRHDMAREIIRHLQGEF